MGPKPFGLGEGKINPIPASNQFKIIAENMCKYSQFL
jgi:hypothetical protein